MVPPLNFAKTICDPTLREFVWYVAREVLSPSLNVRGTAGCGLPSTVKITLVPPDPELDACASVTSAVKITFWPKMDGFLELWRVVDVELLDMFTCWVIGSLVDGS